MDSGALRAVARAVLAERGGVVVEVGDAVAFAEAFGATYDRAVVATALAWADGWEIAASLRRKYPEISLLMLGDPSAPGAVRQAVNLRVADLVPGSLAGVAMLADAVPQAPPNPSPRLAPPVVAAATPHTETAAETARLAGEIAHDMKEPLRTVRLLVERVESSLAEGDAAAAQSLIARLYDAATRMEDLVDGALADARGVPDEDAPAVSHADRVLDEVLEQLRATLADTAGVVTRDALPELGVPPHQLRQILQNLVANALKYGGDPPEVHVTSRRDGAEWILSVRDNGPGIPPAQRESIFRAFTRGEAGAAPSGHGLGLAICRKVVERAGGRIWVEDGANGGSVFRVSIPAAETVPVDPGESSDRITVVTGKQGR